MAINLASEYGIFPVLSFWELIGGSLYYCNMCSSSFCSVLQFVSMAMTFLKRLRDQVHEPKGQAPVEGYAKALRPDRSPYVKKNPMARLTKIPKDNDIIG